jgi:hypothetical protein
MRQVLVLGVGQFTLKDGRKIGRVVVASTPRNPNYRGLSAAEIEAAPEVLDAFKVLPGLYRLEVEMEVATGYGGRANEVRQVVVAAEFIAELVPGRKEVKQS